MNLTILTIQKRLIFLITLCFYSSFNYSLAAANTISLFPLDNYSQKANDWINPNNSKYNSPLFDKNTQKEHAQRFFEHSFADSSPWDEKFVLTFLHHSSPSIHSMEANLIKNFSNQSKPDLEIGYGENFRAYSNNWIEKIASNMQLDQIKNLNFAYSKRAIAVDNLSARLLPTSDVHFYHYSQAGQGFPFDNLQQSAVWVGTPLYIIGESRDHAWKLVLTPDIIGWVPSAGIAYVSQDFISKWQKAAKENMVAISNNEVSITDTSGQFKFLAYVGTVFPGVRLDQNSTTVMIPVKKENGNAKIELAHLPKNISSPVPTQLTPHNFISMMNNLLGRPYGWGNLYFYNDCSAELKNIFATFGVWLPRLSSEQVKIGKTIDLSYADREQRIDYLQQNAHPFVTIVYINGHVFLYLGNYTNPNTPGKSPVALTYQNIWALKPEQGNERVIIGGSVLLPLMNGYPEDQRLSLANKTYFKLAYLDILIENNNLSLDDNFETFFK